MSVIMMRSFRCSADPSCSEGLGTAGRCLWSVEHLEGAESGKAGEKGLKLGRSRVLLREGH